MSRYTVKLFSIVLSTAVFFMSPLMLIAVPVASATPSPSSWNAGRIIDDSVFFNSTTMSSQDIQNFLNSKEGGCTGSCLKDYSQNVPATAADSYCGAISGGTKSAATIIKEVTSACSMNPQAMLVLIQKEQGLVTDTSPTNYEYQFATGFCVYDTTPPPACAGTDGFFNQIYYGARQFQKYAKNPNSYTYAAGRTSDIYYKIGCSTSPVYVQNAATAGLYNYTPYQPNQAALNAGYGTGDGCSAYGNRNFWLYFSDWFGNPIGNEYAWLIQSWSYSNGDNILTAGYTETITLKALNVSRHTWYNHGDHPIRLATFNPENRNSPIFPTTLATLQENSVDPNQVGTFQFQVNPRVTGTFVESLNLVAENYAWMSWPGFSPTIIVTNNPYQWQVSGVSYGNGTGVMDPDSTQSMVVHATNTGNVTWDKSSPPVWLGTWPPGRGSPVSASSGGKWPSATRITQFNETSVPPGGQASFQFNVHVPASGNYYESLNLVAEGQNWFNDAGLILYLHGKTYNWQPVWTSISTGNANIARNQTFQITVKAHNNGEATWNKAAPSPVRLGTSNPLNRGSALYSPSDWLSDIRPASLVESSVPPGGDGTFTFTAKTPNTPGSRNECFTPVAEGTQWFNDAGMCFKINVL